MPLSISTSQSADLGRERHLTITVAEFAGNRNDADWAGFAASNRAFGLVELAPDWIVVTPKGRLLVRAIAMLFDRYLRQARQSASYSRVI
jgi:hypothetical protein